MFVSLFSWLLHRLMFKQWLLFISYAYYVDIGPLSRYYVDMCPLSRYSVDMCLFSGYCVDICLHRNYCADRFCWFLAVSWINTLTHMVWYTSRYLGRTTCYTSSISHRFV